LLIPPEFLRLAAAGMIKPIIYIFSTTGRPDPLADCQTEEESMQAQPVFGQVYSRISIWSLIRQGKAVKTANKNVY